MKTKDKFEFLNKEFTLKDIANFLAILFVIFKPAIKKSIFILALFAALFAGIGYFAKLTSPKEFESQCVLYDEEGVTNPNSSLQALNLLAGANPVSEQTKSSNDDLYQLILTNKPFLLELAKTPIYIDGQKKSIKLEQYFDKDTELDAIEKGLNSINNWIFSSSNTNSSKKSLITDSTISNQLKGSFANKVYISKLTADDNKIISILSSRIKLTQLGKLSTLYVKMPEASLSAEVNKVVLELLIKYAIRIKASKQLENVEFLEARTAEAEVKYKDSQRKAAQFKDNNYNVIFQSVQIQENVLQNNFVLYSNIYNQLVAQLEQAKIQLKKDSPLFTVLEPVYIPSQIATDNSKIISYLMRGIIVGLLISIYIFFKCFKAYKSNTFNN